MILGEQEQWKNAEMCAVIYHSAVGDPGDSTTRWASTETQGFFSVLWIRWEGLSIMFFLLCV